jgi:hypothetical protein
VSGAERTVSRRGVLNVSIDMQQSVARNRPPVRRANFN